MQVPTYRRTVDGHEATIQVNHLAPFLLSRLLRDRLSGGRIISTAVKPAPNVRLDPDDLDDTEQRYRGIPAYQNSKAANILFTIEAAQRWPDILSLSFHPGVVRTNIGRNSALRFFFRYAPFLLDPQKSAERLVWLATAPTDELSNGGFYDGTTLYEPRRRIINPESAARLWVTTDDAVTTPLGPS
jgi:NAD(P)-dependent dehydrogenase (short-subunit alcohol dehydrogenase family)